jgi:hypothetical protein
MSASFFKISSFSFSVGGTRKIKGRTISLDVPVDIIQQTAVDAARLQLSPTQHQGIIAAVINVSGGTA